MAKVIDSGKNTHNGGGVNKAPRKKRKSGLKAAGILFAVLLVAGGVSKIGSGDKTGEDANASISAEADPAIASDVDNVSVTVSSEADPVVTSNTDDASVTASSEAYSVAASNINDVSANNGDETVGGSHVEAISMEIIRNSIGDDVAVCTLEWTNLSGRRTSAGWSVTVDAYQNGAKLGHGALADDSRYDGMTTMEDAEPGDTKTVQYCFNLDNVYDPVELRVSKYLDQSGEYAAFQFDTGNGDMPDMNVGQGWVEFRGIDVLKNSIGTTCLVVTANWTNYGAEADDANFTIFCEAYQNGRELRVAGLAMNDAYDAWLVQSKIEPGVSTDVQYVFELDDDSPVDVKIFEYLGDPDSGVSQTFDVSGFNVW